MGLKSLEAKLIRSDANHLRRAAWRLGAVVGLAIVPSALFRPVMQRFGIDTTPLVGLAVAAAGWFFGVPGGLIAGVSAVLLNAGLHSSLLENGGRTWLLTSWPENLLVLLAGFLSGRLRQARGASSELQAVMLHDDPSPAQPPQIEKRLKEANALVDIGLVLSQTEQLGLETVLQIIIDSARDLIPGAERAVLHLIDGEQQILVPRAVSGFTSESKTKLHMRLGEGIAGQVIATGEVAVVPDVQTDSRFLAVEEPVKFRSLIVAPVQSNRRRVGTISIQSDEPNAFSTENMRLLQALGTQAALAIENTDLLETTRQGLKETNALFRISQVLAASMDPGQLMRDTVDRLQQNFGYYHVQVFVKDPATEDLVLQEAAGEIGAQLKEQGYRLPKGTGVIGHAVETGDPFLTNNVDQMIFYIPHYLLPATKSELTMPIKIRGEVVGVLDIQDTADTNLTPRHLQLMKSVADQLAVALQKANLYADLQNALEQEKAMRTQLIQSERLAVVGRLLASVSHELNNPLQAIQNALFLIREEKGFSGQSRQDLEIVLSETERMAEMLERLRTAYRPTRAHDVKAVPLNEIVEAVHALVATHMRHNEVTFEFHAQADLPPVAGVSDQLRQVVLNLILNAVEAMEPGGRVAVSTEFQEGEDAVLLTTRDSGPGINPTILPNIFEPFITDKENGTGLGLTITYDIVRQHKGRIAAANDPAGGAVFQVWLPVWKGGTE